MSSPSVLPAYLRERMRPRVMLPLTVLTTAAALTVSGTVPETQTIIRSAIAAFALIMGFRVWDDLEDRDYDRVHHPARVVSRTPANRQFIGLALISLLVAISLLTGYAQPSLRIASLGIASALALAWYRTRPPGAEHRVWGAHLVLAKYPLIACAIAPALPFSLRGASVLIGLYLALCIHEAVDDPELRRLPRARGVALVELLLLVPLLLAAAKEAVP
jgi:4-hydroxybenzoate polyprenyltransferase